MKGGAAPPEGGAAATDAEATVPVLVKSAEGEDVAWPRTAAARSAVLANWLDDTDGDAPFPTPLPTAALRTLAQLAGVGGGDAEGVAVERRGSVADFFASLQV